MRFIPFAAGALATIVCAAAYGQQYPTRVVRIVSAEAGGGGDFVARVVAQGLTEALGQQVIVENRGGVQAMEAVARAQPDGYTVLLHGSSIWLMPFLRESVAWDPLRDYVPVTIPASSPNILVVHPSLPVKTIGDLIRYAKAKPGDLNFGALTGGSAHLAAELFKSMAEVNIVFIPFRGNGPAMTALMGGQVHMMFPNAPSATPHVKSGRLRALAVTSAQPSQLAPGLPTVSASGLPGYETVSMHAILLPARTPPAIVTRLNQEIVKVVQSPESTKRLIIGGVEPMGSTPEDVTKMMKAEMTRMGKVIRDAGIRAE
jgi:tripartite-type tricarboxylate transporter receptor subunit TctC